jgi:hypothetical protein
LLCNVRMQKERLLCNVRKWENCITVVDLKNDQKDTHYRYNLTWKLWS